MFIRTCSRPRRDLDRGFSYAMGEFGNPDQAHAGLSGYSLARGTEDAVSALAARMGVSGAFSSKRTVAFDRRPHRRVAPSSVMFVAVFEGSEVGTGPDGEELFRPSRIVATFRTTSIKSPADLAAMLAAIGIN